MLVLGVNFGHDSAASIIKDGKLLYSIEEEKLSRVKQDFGWPTMAIRKGFRQTGIAPADVDVVAVGGMIFSALGPGEIRYRFNKRRSDKWIEYCDRSLAYAGIRNHRFTQKNKTIFAEALREAGLVNAHLKFYNHHLCHAAGAYYCAPFVPDVVITCDGHGDGESFNFYVHDSSRGLVALETNDFRVSVGAFYSVVTEMLGFRPTRHEGKITGLAAFGTMTPLVDRLSELFRWNGAGQLERYPFGDVKTLWKSFGLDKRFGLSQRINMFTSEAAVGVEYTQRYEILAARVRELCTGYSKEDIAYATQKVAERIVIEETRRVFAKHFGGKPQKVALAGGVFANVRINQLLYEISEVDEVFVQPAMGDSGLAIGAAILADIEFGKRNADTRYAFRDTYHGPEFSVELHDFLEQVSRETVIERMENPAQRIAELLKENVVIGFWHGRMEWGPRALGKRSMIINTFNREVNDSVNKRLNRTEFMPFAPSVIDYMAKTYMPAYDGECPAAEYMTITYDVAPEYHKMLQAIVHVDGTARPHVVRREANPYYYDILDAFYKLTGCGAIVNTSFNVHEEPIVSTPASAYKALQEDRIDVLVMEEYLIRRPNSVLPSKAEGAIVRPGNNA